MAFVDLATNSMEPPAAAERLLGAATEVAVHSGNIASWNKLRKKGVMTTTDEAVSATQGAFKSWLGRQNSAEVSSCPIVRNAGLVEKVKPNDRDRYIFTVKLFLSRWEGSLVRQALEKTLSELGVSSVNTTILAFPPCQDGQLTADNMLPVWRYMEQLARDGLTKSVGTADLSTGQLQDLYEQAAVKPTVNQVNLAHCCTIPEDMVEFAKLRNISLLTHNDEREILPHPQLQTALDSTPLGGDHTPWTLSWVARYSSVVKLRGIIAHKGYLLGLGRDTS